MNARMIRIIHYLNKERMASYKEIAEALDIKERSVRYDIDGINGELSLRRMDQIEKLSKGMLMVPDQLNLDELVQEDTFFVFSPEERKQIVKFYVLFGIDKLNIRKLTDDLAVSRRSIQNDLESVSEELAQYQLTLVFNRKYRLDGESEKSFDLRCNLMKDILPAMYKKEHHNDFERYILNGLKEVFESVSVEDIWKWINGVIDDMGWVFSDQSYHRYVASVLTFTWYLIHQMELPQEEEGMEGQIRQGLRAYEKLIGRPLSEREKGILFSFSRYTTRYENLDINMPMVKAEDCARDLVNLMSQELHVDFAQDGILAKGLINHLTPLLERIRSNKLLNEDVSDLVPEGYEYIYQALDSVLSDMDPFYRLTENEKIYLAIYFMGSLRRIQRESYKTVLLVCGYGYGTTTMLKDTLLNEYQVTVKESLPAYQVTNYQDWDDVDVVLSTVKLALPVDKPFAQVNIVFNKEDYVKLDFLGLKRKQVLTDYFAIERRLNFLKEEDRLKVMNVLKEELGLREVRPSKRYHNLSDLLQLQHIRCVDHIDTWEDAIQAGTDILKNEGLIEEQYYESILRGIEIQGFYSVTNHKFALLHGKAGAGVHRSCMSLIVSHQPVIFGEKEVNLIFCLASLDKKAHIPAVVSLSRMAEDPAFIRDLSETENPQKAIETIRNYEEKLGR